MPHLIPMLKTDMQNKLKWEFSIDVQSMMGGAFAEEGSFAASGNTLKSTCGDEVPSDLIVRDGNTNFGLMEGEGAVSDTDIDIDGILDIADVDDELSNGDSGFGLEGKPVLFNSSRFWNYVDYMLNLLCEMAHKDTSMKEEFKRGVAGIMVQIFQDDLLVCPGHRKVMRLMATNPQWQTTIQHGLMW
ncbi:hypothetical protein EDC04DRAFT_2905439 [Pisolithus marmoratus]|nr:hypothetical protein EDC04DRAFT_2905439 [Pisolithus marmoratus]